MLNRFCFVFIVFIFTVFISFHGFTQNAERKLTLEDALELAKQQSPDALNAKQAFLSSYWQYKTFRGTYLPNIVIGATIPNLYRSINKTTNTDKHIEEFSRQQYSNYIGNISISQRIGFTGGSLSVNSGLQRMDNYYNKTDTSKAYTNTAYLSNPINITLIQPIFKYNPYKWERKIQPLLYDISKRKFLEDIEQVNLTTTNNFFNLLQAQIEKKIAQTTLANYDTLYQIAIGRFQLGKIAQNELLSLKLRVLNGRAAVENAALNLDQALYRFKSFLRIKDTIPIILIPPAGITYFNVDPVRAVDLATQNSSKVLEFNHRELEAASNVNKAKMDGRFDAELRADFGYNNTAPTIKQTYKSPQDKEVVSLGLTIPVLDWGVSRGQIKVAQSNQEIENNKVAQERIDFQREVYLLGIQFNMQKNQVMIAALSDTVAKQTYDVTKGRYLIGKNVTITELNTSQSETDGAQRDYYSALKTYWSTYFHLRQLTLYDFILNEPLRFNWEEVKP